MTRVKLFTLPVFAILLMVTIAPSCKRCYQCAVRDSSSNDSVLYYYKEVCVTKKDFKAYKSICNDGLDTTAYYCQCEEDLSIE